MIRAFSYLLVGLLLPLAAGAAEPAEQPLAQLRAAAMRSDYALEQARWLSDRIGPRLSGSAGHVAAVDYVAAEMARLGLNVRLQPVKVPHWVRGEERGSLVEYPGRPDGVEQNVVLTALGSSAATPPDGLVREIVVVRSFEELESLGRAGVADKFVLLYSRFDTFMAANGRAGEAYGLAGTFRFRGPSAAAELGAAAALVRSVGGAEYRLPHTGATTFADGVQPIPSAALTAEDADLILRLSADGRVKMRLLLTPRTLPDADSFNVIGDLEGTAGSGELVVVSGHLDSWDLGTGAHDDAAGVATAMAAAALMRQLKIRPRRTVRVIAWANEESGTSGAKAYFSALDAEQLRAHVAAIESDMGGGRPIGVFAHITPESLEQMAPWRTALQRIGASLVELRRQPTGADIGPLGRAGVPNFAPLVDGRTYFDYHHTAADTFDKLDPEQLRYQSAVMATLAWWLADREAPLPRLAPQAEGN